MKKRSLAGLLLALALLTSCAAPAVTGTTAAVPETTAAAETETTPAAEPETSAAVMTEPALSPEKAYQCGADIVPEEPAGEMPQVTGLTLLGKDLSEYAVVLPTGADPETEQAADLLAEYVKKATGVAWNVLTETEADPAKPLILLGETGLESGAVKERREALSDDGYLLFDDGGKLCLSGATGRGTRQGVIAFLKDTVGWRFFADDCETVLPEKAQSLEAGCDISYSPTFDFRCSFYQFAIQSEKYDTMHQLRGIQYAMGRRVHTLAELAEMTTGNNVGVQPCLTDEAVYQTVKKNVISWLEQDPTATVVSVSQNDSAEADLGCQCEKCCALNEKYGSEGGALFAFVNRLATELKPDYPDVMFETLAYRYSVVPPKDFEFSDNVMVMLCLMDCCYTHTIDDPDCAMNNRFCEYFENWAQVCDHMSVWDYHTNFAFYNTIFPNYNILYDHVKYYAEHNVISVFNEGNFNSRSGQFEELRSYLMSEMMWNPQMTREEYAEKTQEFMKAYYGPGWAYLARFMDITEARSRADGNHFSLYTGPREIVPYQASVPEDAEWLDDMDSLFARAYDLAETDAQRDHVEKGSIQVKYFRLHFMGKMTDEKLARSEELYNLLKKHGVTRLIESRELGEITDFHKGPSW